MDTFNRREFLETHRGILVVRIHFKSPNEPIWRLKERLEWLRLNVYPERIFSLAAPRALLIESSPQVSIVAEAIGGELAYWDVYHDPDDFYAKLMNQKCESSARPSPSLFSAVFLNVRNDKMVGMAWGLPEGNFERPILRALTIATDGNVLFGDWGWAGNTRPDVTHDELRRIFVVREYMYVHRQLRLMRNSPEHIHGNIPFANMLGHFLRPQYSADETLSKENMNRIRKLSVGQLFDGATRSRALRNAHFDLWFVSDAFKSAYHRWPTFYWTQRCFVFYYIHIRVWLSSTWFELLMDALLFILSDGIFLAVLKGIQEVTTFPIASTNPLRFCGWFALRNFVYIDFSNPQDRPSLWDVFKDMLMVSLFSSCICEPLMWIFWQRISTMTVMIGLTMGVVDTWFTSQIKWIVWCDQPKLSIPAVLLTWTVTMLIFQHQMFEVSTQLVEACLLWYYLGLRFGRSSSPWFLLCIHFGFGEYRSFVFVPGCLGIVLTIARFIGSSVWMWLSNS